MAPSHGRASVLWLVVLSAACARSSEVRCADGRLCPPGTTCDDVNSRCLSPAQLSACEGLAEGSPCTVTGAPGACRAGACDPLVCGDGVRSLSEACDGDDLGGATCTTAGFYEPAGLACSPFCTFETSACVGRCGDGVVNGTELCDTAPPASTCFDYGFDAGAVTCGSSCGVAFDACARFGWTPEPTGLENMYAVVASGVDDVWGVGSVGSEYRVAHHDGTAWTTEVVDVPGLPIAVTLAAPGEPWVIAAAPAGGADAIVRRVAGQWVSAGAPSAEYNDIWAAASTEVFVATQGAGVLRWDGTAWTTLGTLSGSLRRVRATGATNVWAVRDDGTLHHWNGSTWSAISVAVTVHDLVVRAVDDVWVAGASTVGSGAAAAHWDGVSWTVSVEPRDSTWTRVVVRAENDVWVTDSTVVRHFDGVRWSTHDTVSITGSAGAIVGLAHLGELVLAGGFDGYLYRYRHQAYIELGRLIGQPSRALATAGPYATVVIPATARTAYHFDGSTWTARAVDTDPVPTSLLYVAATSATDVWTVGASGRVSRFDGSTWSLVEATGVSPKGLLVFAPADAWVLSPGAVYRYDGTTFQLALDGVSSNAGAPFDILGGTGPTNVWAVTRPRAADNQSEVWRYDGTTWTMTVLPYEVWALSVIAPDRAFAIAQPNTVLVFDGTTWTPTTLPLVQPLISISAASADDVFALTSAEIVHFDGQRWRPVRTPALLSANAPLLQVVAGTDFVELLYGGAVPPHNLMRLVRTRPWVCAAAETACADGVDNDCDGVHDAVDADCL